MLAPNLPNQSAPAGPPSPFGEPMPSSTGPLPAQNDLPPQQQEVRDPMSTDVASTPPAQPQTPPPAESAPPQPNSNEYAAYEQAQAGYPALEKPMPEEELFSWTAPSRPFKQRNRQYFSTIALICGLIGLILFFAGQMLPVAVIAAVFFAYYVLNSTPPGLITHKVTTYGIRVEDKLYFWEEMGRFWFTEKFGSTILNIEVASFPNRLNVLLGDLNKEDMKLFLSEMLLNQEPPPTAYEKAAQWLYRKLPIDIES